MDKNKERLYLSKGDTEDNNVYVDTVPLPHHQYDGVRFLYKQYKKGRAGVILNDPSGYGKRVQTVLFLSALSPMWNLPALSLPMLILCPEGRENVWLHLFRQWTTLGNDVLVQRGHEYTKSMCVIGNFSQVYLFARREWSVLVVDDNNVSREMLRSGITASFRIWITSIDMKKNLQTFSLIYKWLYPRDRFLVEDFQSTRKKPSHMLAKSNKLDTFMEDIVIRRRDVTVPLGTPHNTVDPPKVSRKNKDATGKKIKRSKPLPASQDETNSKTEETTSKVIPEKTENGEAKSKIENVEDFRSSNEEKSHAFSIKLPDIISITGVKEMKYISDDVQSEINMEVDINDTEDKQNLENDCVNKAYFENDSVNISSNDDSLSSQKLIIKYDSETPDLDEAIHDDDVPAKRLKINSTTEINEISASEDLFQTDTEPSDIQSENKISVNEIISDNVDTKNCASNVKSSESISKDTKEHDNEVINSVKCNKNGLDSIVGDNNKTETKLEGIELKIKEMEELAMKKFKGTFLDSIF